MPRHGDIGSSEQASTDHGSLWSPLPLTLDQNGKPHIQAQLLHPDGRAIAADLMVDTGGRGLLVLTRPFVEEHDLEKTLQPPLQAIV